MKGVHTYTIITRKGTGVIRVHIICFHSITENENLLNLRRSIHWRKEKVHKTTLHPQRPHDDHNKNKSQTTQWATKCKVMIRGGKMEKKTTTQKSKGKLQRKQRHPRRLRRCWPSLRSHQTTQPTVGHHTRFTLRVGRERYHPATRPAEIWHTAPSSPGNIGRSPKIRPSKCTASTQHTTSKKVKWSNAAINTLQRTFHTLLHHQKNLNFSLPKKGTTNFSAKYGDWNLSQI